MSLHLDPQERVAGIEPAIRAWEALVIPLHHTRVSEYILRTNKIHFHRVNSDNTRATPLNRDVTQMNPSNEAMAHSPVSCHTILDGLDLGGFWALTTLAKLELDLLSFLERSEARTGDVGEVNEEVLSAVFRGNESIPLLAVEPLHRTTCHVAYHFLMYLGPSAWPEEDTLSSACVHCYGEAY